MNRLFDDFPVAVSRAFLLLGVVVALCTSMLLHQPHIARFIFAGMATAAVCVFAVRVTIDAHDQKMAILPGIFMALAIEGVPLYFLLSGLSVHFWPRYIWAGADIVIFVAALAVSVELDARKHKRIQTARLIENHTFREAEGE